MPAGVLGPVDDANFRWVNDVGLTGPEPARAAATSSCRRATRASCRRRAISSTSPRTNTLLFFFRAFVKDGDIAAAVDSVKAARRCTRSTPRPKRPPPEADFVNTSGLRFNTISANDFSFYEELNQAVQAEPADWVDPDTVGLFASIGILKGQPFAPDERMKAILTDAVASATPPPARSSSTPRTREVYFYPDRKWFTPFVGGSYQFLDGAERLLDARTMFFYYATGITPAMAMAKVGSGSAYAVRFRDANGDYPRRRQDLQGHAARPGPGQGVLVLRRLRQPDPLAPGNRPEARGRRQHGKELKVDADGSVTVWFGPKAPEGQEANWVQTMPGKGFNILLRLYGPLEPWFDKSWKPGDLEVVQ